MTFFVSVERIAELKVSAERLAQSKVNPNSLIDLTCKICTQCSRFLAEGTTNERKTRSQAVARIADRTAENCRGHVT